MPEPQNLLRQAQSLGFSLRDVARMAGVSPAAVSKWQHGAYAPSPQRDEQLAQVQAWLDSVTPEVRNYLRNGKARRAWIRQRVREDQ